jgi:phosphate starvation-inducible PhoH-like protein
MNREEPITFTVPGNDVMAQLVGVHDENLREVERQFASTRILVRGNEIVLSGGEAEAVARIFSELLKLTEQGHTIDRTSVSRTIETVRAGGSPSEIASTHLARTAAGKAIRPRTAGQKSYAEAIKSNTITVVIGPAGTGKSYLAVAMAVAALQKREVSRIILTRPAVEAGERLGFLPGDFLAKVNPYLRPLYDALLDLMEHEVLQRMIDKGTIEVAPLAYMRGRTLNDSFVILDEAQNTSREQMKMFLTRIGFNTKAVITGDVTQIDIPGGRAASGLVGLREIVGGIKGVAFVELTKRDVVRNPLVAAIVEAYERHGA